MRPAAVLGLLDELRAHLRDRGPARHRDDLELVVLGAAAPFDGQIAQPSRVAHVLDARDERSAGSDHSDLLFWGRAGTRPGRWPGRIRIVTGTRPSGLSILP